MKKLLFFALVVSYIATAFGLGNGFEVNLIPFNWDKYLLVKFLIVFMKKCYFCCKIYVE